MKQTANKIKKVYPFNVYIYHKDKFWTVREQNSPLNKNKKIKGCRVLKQSLKGFLFGESKT